MSFRDDRDALRQRVEQLESELDDARDKLAAKGELEPAAPQGDPATIAAYQAHAKRAVWVYSGTSIALVALFLTVGFGSSPALSLMMGLAILIVPALAAYFVQSCPKCGRVPSVAVRKAKERRCNHCGEILHPD